MKRIFDEGSAVPEQEWLEQELAFREELAQAPADGISRQREHYRYVIKVLRDLPQELPADFAARVTHVAAGYEVLAQRRDFRLELRLSGAFAVVLVLAFCGALLGYRPEIFAHAPDHEGGVAWVLALALCVLFSELCGWLQRTARR